jgi:hypothetical protein
MNDGMANRETEAKTRHIKQVNENGKQILTTKNDRLDVIVLP